MPCLLLLKTKLLEMSYQTFLQSKSEKLAAISFLISILCITIAVSVKASRTELSLCLVTVSATALSILLTLACLSGNKVVINILCRSLSTYINNLKLDFCLIYLQSLPLSHVYILPSALTDDINSKS